MRRKDEFESVFEMFLDEVIEDSPFELRTDAAIEPKTVAAHADTAFIVDEAEFRAEVDMIFRLEIEGWFFAPYRHYFVGFFPAGNNAGCRHIGER